MPLLFINNFSTTLSQATTALDTTIYIPPADAQRLIDLAPSPWAPEHFYRLSVLQADGSSVSIAVSAADGVTGALTVTNFGVGDWSAGLAIICAMDAGYLPYLGMVIEPDDDGNAGPTHILRLGETGYREIDQAATLTVEYAGDSKFADVILENITAGTPVLTFQANNATIAWKDGVAPAFSGTVNVIRVRLMRLPFTTGVLDALIIGEWTGYWFDGLVL